MKTKQIISLILAVCLVSGAVSAYAATAGGADDPLISKSYADNDYPSIVLGEPLQMMKDSMAALEYKLKSAVNGTDYTSVSAGGSLTVSSGGSFTFLSGAGRVTRLSGTLIDVTDGTTVSSGQALTAMHRYVSGGSSSANISVSSSSRVSTMGSVAVKSAAMPFTDVPSTEWYYEYVLYSYANGFIEGKSPTSFAPKDNLTVAEAIKLSACMHQLYNTGFVSLTDAAGAAWYTTYVEYAKTNGIVTKTYSNYNAYIARDEFVSVFYSALPTSEYPEKNSVADNAIPDVKLTSNYAAQIYAFYRTGILDGNDAIGTFNPGANILRSEVTAIMTRMFEKDMRLSFTLQ